MAQKKTMQRKRKVNGAAQDRDAWKAAVPGHTSMKELHHALRAGIAERWNRSLPFNEELFCRWERAKSLGFGKEASIYDSSIVIGDVSVGAHTWIGPSTILDGSGGLSIGSYCSISAGAQIYTHDTVAWALTGGKAAPVKDETKIGDSVYVGPQAVISRGVTIGDHSVIGAMSFVHEDVPPYSVAFGVPATVVGKVIIKKGEVSLKFNA